MKVNARNTNCYYKIKITGLVQGVGFRPFIYRIANEFNLNGWVENRNDGVIIKIEAEKEIINKFSNAIREKAPVASNIELITVENTDPEVFYSFQIKKSENISNKVTEISPDITVCENCLIDLKKQKHRLNYPFINCTNCGPRFTIIKSLPYDRPKTTMHEFEMCETCKKEYKNILDRRFHAQPIACNNCGPIYTLIESEKKYENFDEILLKTAYGIDNEKLYAIKGQGGFHLMCNALNNNVVKKLRNLKQRDGKPFAVMFKSIVEAKKYAHINVAEEELLTSWRRPIVLLNKKNELAYEVCNGLSKIGIMLPYMPFHHLLFEKLKTPVIVLTSGNLSDEPIILSNGEALEKFNKGVNGFITYNREIFNRTDDSVSMVMNNNPRIIRRSRGYTPQPIRTLLNTESIFAAGAELVNSFCIGKGNQAILSQYIGDLKNFETFDFYKETYERFSKLLKFKPEIVVRDLHPDYLSSQFADQLEANSNKIKKVKVQHHHAHIASVMLDNELDENVIGISFDGIGLGTDGNIWGAEFLNASLSNFEREFYFEYQTMPGGDKATKEPWRMAISYLYDVYGTDLYQLDIPFLKSIDKSKIESLIQIIDKKINCPLTSSAGRLFDAVTSLIDILQVSSFHAEAPMRLEAIIDSSVNEFYNYDIRDEKISFKNTIRQLINDIQQKVSKSVISAKFHNTIIEIILDVSNKIKLDTGIKKVVLSGGTFQNKYITEKIEKALIKNKFKVYLPESIPVNDQGIAVGQLAIAAKRRELGLI